MFRLTIILSLFITTLTFSQELACTVTVDARQTGNENLQIFKSPQTQLTDFINNTKWTNRNIKNNERIDCSMFINISSYDNDSFQATLQIQSSRPIYNSSYNSPVYNFNDKNFTFRYQEFQNLILEIENSLKKLKNKNLDLIILNSLNDKGAGFGTETNKITIINKKQEQTNFDLKDKSEVAEDILKSIMSQINV